MSGRRIPITEETRCGTCRRPVLLVSGADFHALMDRLSGPGGRLVPHACPEEAVRAFHLRDTFRRLGDPRERAAAGCHRDNGRRIHRDDAALRDSPSPQGFEET